MDDAAEDCLVVTCGTTLLAPSPDPASELAPTLRVKVSRTPTPLQITEHGSPDQTHVDLDHPRHHHGHRAGPH